MNILSWFTPKNKKNIVIPSGDLGPLRGLELVTAFSTPDEPKAKDFPKDKFTLYWETFLDAIPGGYGALVRFYKLEDGSIFSEHVISKQSLGDLRAEVTKVIMSTMTNNRK